MKINYSLFIIFFLRILFCNAQQSEVSVEKNMYGVQLGLVGLHLHNETKLERKFALRSEVSVSLVSFHGNSDNIDYLVAPSFVVEPRFYYGLDRRSRLGKNTKHNGSNFISLKSRYQTNWLLTESDTYDIVPYISFTPMYGIRRNFAKNINYEFSFGLGYLRDLEKAINRGQNNLLLDIQVRIGYNF